MGLTYPIDVPITARDGLSPKLGKIGQAIGRVGGIAKAAGRNLTVGVTLPVVALGASSIGTAAKFETAINRVEALTSAAPASMAVLEKQAMDLGASTEFSATQAAEAQGFLAQAGLDVVEILGTLPPVLNLASAGQLDLATAADLTTNIMAGFGLKTEQAAWASDVLAEATTKGNTDLLQLADAMKTAGPVADGLGQKFTTVVAILDKLADAGLQGQLGGTALKNGMVLLAQKAEAGHKTLRKLKISAGEIFNDTGGMIDFLDLLDLLKERGATGRDVISLFGAKGSAGVLKLMKEGTGEARKLADLLENSVGRAASIAETQLKGAAGDLASFRASWEALQITIARSGLLDLFKEGVQLLTVMIDKVRATNPLYIKLGLVFAGVAAVVGPLLIVFGSLLTATASAISLVTTLSPLLVTIGGFISATLVPAVTALGGAFLAFMVSPLGLAVTAIGAVIGAGVYLVTHWDEVSKKAAAAWGAIKWAVGSSIDWIWKQIKSLELIVPDFILDLFSSGNAAESDAATRASSNLDAARVRAANIGTAAAPAVAGAQVGGRLEVDFRNVPRGVDVRQSTGGDVPVDVDVGMNLDGAA